MSSSTTQGPSELRHLACDLSSLLVLQHRGLEACEVNKHFWSPLELKNRGFSMFSLTSRTRIIWLVSIVRVLCCTHHMTMRWYDDNDDANDSLNYDDDSNIDDADKREDKNINAEQ